MPPPRPAPPTGIQSFRRDVVALAVSGDGRFLAGGDLAGQTLVWELPRATFLWADATAEGNRFGRAAFASDRPVFALGSFHAPDKPFHVYSAEPLERRATFGSDGWTGLDLALDPSGAVVLGLSGTTEPERYSVELATVGGEITFSVPVEHAARGAVAMYGRGELVAVSDDLGGLRVWRPPSTDPILVVEPTRGDADLRIARLLFTGPATLVAATGRTLRELRLDTGAPSPGTPVAPDVTAQPAPVDRDLDVRGTPAGVPSFDPEAPIRGLHPGPSGVRVVTRPVAGGLEVYGLDGRPLARLDTGCRCEIHALSASGDVAACGCVEASEIRWGRLTPVR
ncbi:MAG: hypothetical protein JNJ59_06355 [Deltaproteobacteria bacterium]|nr:hypothetical protein [Deltaproteobacteria bacterium]